MAARRSRLGRRAGTHSTKETTMPRRPARAPKPITRSLPLAVALEELRQDGVELVHLHLPASEGGHGFYVVPGGGRVKDKDAQKILARPDVKPYSAGLFPENVQSWKLVAPVLSKKGT
jgi:hypothetical protein